MAGSIAALDTDLAALLSRPRFGAYIAASSDGTLASTLALPTNTDLARLAATLLDASNSQLRVLHGHTPR